MKVFIQWATDPKSRPEEIDSRDWLTLPKKADPTRQSVTIDSAKGWIQSLTVMGVTFSADHIALEENPPGYPAGSITVTYWNDSDAEEDKRHAGIWYFQDMKLIDFNGRQRWQPNNYEERFYSPRLKQKLIDDGILPIYAGNREVKINRYADFIPPSESITKHGVLLSDILNAEYEIDKSHSYKEWI